MFKKIVLIILLAVATSLMLIGCISNEIFPQAIPLENSIKEIILSKGENYNFLNDELFMNKVEEYAMTLVSTNTANSKYYAIGNLDDDNVPELVIFIERNPKNVDDQGGLGVYKFTGEKYELLDKVNMNYDNSNYLLQIGKISHTRNGILLSNQVGAKSGVTYGFILEDGKLTSILNEKKISLISILTKNEIKDIDGDGILEFSIYTIDPETEDQSPEGSDKLILWYKWDEKDSGILVKVEREATINSTMMSVSEANIANISNVDIKEIADDKMISYLYDNIENYHRDKLVETIDYHINRLINVQEVRDKEFNNLMNKYTRNLLFDKYELSTERLNDIEYLKREKVLQSEIDLKEHLIASLNMGFKLDQAEGIYFYKIDYQKFLNKFADNITNQYRDYLKIKAMNSNEPYLVDGELTISLERLAHRIVEVENFKLTYPYSKYLDEVNVIYESYLLHFLFGSVNTPTYDINTGKYNENLIPILTEISLQYEDTFFANIVQEFLNNLKLSLYTIDGTLINNITSILK